MQDAEYRTLDSRISALYSRMTAIEERQRTQEIRIRIFDSVVSLAKRSIIGIAGLAETARRDVQRINAKTQGQEEIPLGD